MAFNDQIFFAADIFSLKIWEIILLMETIRIHDAAHLDSHIFTKAFCILYKSFVFPFS